MTKKYCMDTSALSNPLQAMPPDIHKSMWAAIVGQIEGGIIAVTSEIYSELLAFDVDMPNNCIADNRKKLLLEVGHASWEWASYARLLSHLLDKYHDYLSENQNNSRKTICKNDLTTIALAKSLVLPMVSMENKIAPRAIQKLRIPDVCEREQVEHMWFNDFLRNEKLVF